MSTDTIRQELGPLRDHERVLMALRYRYYVMAEPIILDHEYDGLERAFKANMIAAKQNYEQSPINKPGSDNVSDYTKDEVALAMYLPGLHEQLKNIAM